MLFSPVRETRLAALPENPNDFTLAGESLLAVRSPWCVLHARPCLAWTIFGIERGLTLVGILFKIRTTGRFRYISTLAYVIMGWVAVLAIVPPIRSLQGMGTMWLTLGGGLYTLGCVFYLWKSLPYAHMVWHLFVLAGTVCHFFCILWHVM